MAPVVRPHLEDTLPISPTLRRPLVPLLTALLVFAATAAFAAPGSRAAGAPAGGKGERPLTLFYGDDHCFGLVIPEGWVADDSSGMSSKIRVVFYPRGQKWKTAPTVMYVNPIHQDARTVKPLEAMIARDVGDFHKHVPQGKVITAPKIKTRSGQVGEVRYFAPDGTAPLEAVAYMEEKGLVNLLVMSAHDAEGFKSALPAFHDLVFQYRFVAANINTPTNTPPGTQTGPVTR